MGPEVGASWLRGGATLVGSNRGRTDTRDWPTVADPELLPDERRGIPETLGRVRVCGPVVLSDIASCCRAPGLWPDRFAEDCGEVARTVVAGDTVSRKSGRDESAIDCAWVNP